MTYKRTMHSRQLHSWRSAAAWRSRNLVAVVAEAARVAPVVLAAAPARRVA
jgi:hypothetical protein